jgi:hypothetical protein
MKRLIINKYKFLFVLLAVLFFWSNAYSQCYNCDPDGSLNSTNYTDPDFAPDWTAVQHNTVKAGEYMLFNVTEGDVYRWSTIGSEDYVSGMNDRCETTADCTGDLLCKGDIVECTTANQKEKCVTQVCTTGGKCSCTVNTDCSQGICDGGGQCGCSLDFHCGEGYYCNSDGKCSSMNCSLMDTELTLLKQVCARQRRCEGTSDPCTEDSDCATDVKCIDQNFGAYNRNAIYANQSQIEWKADFSGQIALLVSEYKCKSCTGSDCQTTTVKWQKVDSTYCSDCEKDSDYRYPDTSTTFSTPVRAPSYTIAADNDMKAGSYQVFNVVKDNLYRWSTCGDPSFDTQMTLFRGTGTEGNCGQFLAYNDDTSEEPCADGSRQSSVVWKSDFNGQVTLLINQYNCAKCFKSPSSDPWGHCSMTSLGWQLYDCNNCGTHITSAGNPVEPGEAPVIVDLVQSRNYFKIKMEKGARYRFTSVNNEGAGLDAACTDRSDCKKHLKCDTSNKCVADYSEADGFVGILTLRKSGGSACSGDLIEQSELRGDKSHVIEITATENFTAELLLSGPGCQALATSKKARVKIEKIYDPSTRFTDPYVDSDGCKWNGVSMDNITGLMIHDPEEFALIWDDATTYCETLKYKIPNDPPLCGSAGEEIEDWMLPNINILYSVIDFDMYDKATSYSLPSYLTTDGPDETCEFLTQDTDCTDYPEYVCGNDKKCERNNWYWSSTTIVDSAYFAWAVDMKDGLAYPAVKESFDTKVPIPYKILCVRGASVYGELDINRAARERIFSGWACDKSHPDKQIDIYFLIRDAGGNNIAKMSTDGAERIPGRPMHVRGFKYGLTDGYPVAGSLKEEKIKTNCSNTHQTVQHTFELDLNDDSLEIVENIKDALDGKTAPYYVTAYAGNYKTGFIPAGSFVLTPENELFVLSDVCGDSYWTVGEECDDGNDSTEDCEYGTSCEVCAAGCVLGTGNLSYCGDSSVDVTHEECDCGGAADVFDSPPPYTYDSGTCGTALASSRCEDYVFSWSGETCKICQGCNVVTQPVRYCGDGVNDPEEECDLGAENANNKECKKNCTLNFCGDGLVFTGTEVCDAGADNGKYKAVSPGFCDSDCQGYGEGGFCGDGILHRDDCPGAVNPGDTGTWNGMTCVKTPGAAETCDAGTDNGKWRNYGDHLSDPGCNSTCSGIAPYCGDGNQSSNIQTIYGTTISEVCDDGAANETDTYGKCNTDCLSRPRCRDGILHRENCGGIMGCVEVTGANEICDDGAMSGQYGYCNLTCSGIAECGDGILQESHEECDPGNLFFADYAIKEADSCTDQCEVGRFCGDGAVDGSDGELCDHGASNKPLATATGYKVDCVDADAGFPRACKWAHYCGDGYVDGPGGDGYVGGIEVCDDGPGGNKGDYGLCMAGCEERAPYCGDGILQRAICGTYPGCTSYPGANEQCDNGEASNNDFAGTYGVTCRTDCRPARCGDGIVDFDSGEECDDGALNNNTDPDACRTNCKLPKCGDGVVDAGEECDYGEYNNNNGECKEDCTLNVCGDGYIDRFAVVPYTEERAFYRFDEGAGTTVSDSSGNIADRNITGNIFWTNGRFGKSLIFDGTTTSVDLGNPASLQITGDQTISFWVYPTDFSVRRNPYAKAYGGEGTITIETSGRVNYFYGTSGDNTSPYQGFSMTNDLVLNQWTHLVLVRDLTNGVLKWYKNGVKVNEATASYPAAAVSTRNAYIGRGYVSRFAGRLDDLRILAKALTDAEIADYHSGNEVCDDGNTLNGDYCRSDCQEITGYCGDGTIQTNENCDSATFGEGVGAYCTGSCTGVGASMVCQPGCTFYHGFCGDGVIDYVAGEICDHGGADNGNYCVSDCKSTNGSCGDGIVQPNEVCDKATFGDGIGAYCSNDCQQNLGECGDGKVQRGSCSGYTLCSVDNIPGCCEVVEGANELCDDGANNGEYKADPPGYCNSTCSAYGQGGYCGDGDTQGAYENCDDGADNGVYSTTSPNCSADCQTSGGAGYCGDGIKQAGYESCDGSQGLVNCSTGTAPNGNSYYNNKNVQCSGTCSYNYSNCDYCGDGVKNGSEACDSGTGTNRTGWGALQACNTACNAWAPFCGDGTLHREDCNAASEGATGTWTDPDGTVRTCVKATGAWESCEASTFGGALPPGCIACSKYSPIGTIDQAYDGGNYPGGAAASVRGWTCDKDSPQKSLTIDIRFYNKNGVQIHAKTMFANSTRYDVRTSGLCGNTGGFNKFGFNYDPKGDLGSTNYQSKFKIAERPWRVKVTAYDTTPTVFSDLSAGGGTGCKVSERYNATHCHYGGKCGDSSTQSWYGEQCDPVNTSSCPYGTPTCTRCYSNCTTFTQTGPYCGDFIKNGSEQCDNQNESKACSCSYCCESGKSGCTKTCTKNGTQTRSCSGSCSWNSWSACSVSC